MRPRALLAAALGTAATILAYAVLRAVAHMTTHEADPREVFWTAHAAFSWRAATSLFAGALFALTAAQLREERLERSLVPAIVLAAGALALQAVVLP